MVGKPNFGLLIEMDMLLEAAGGDGRLVAIALHRSERHLRALCHRSELGRDGLDHPERAARLLESFKVGGAGVG